MSISNIISIEPVFVGGIPVAAKVKFKTKKGTRTYIYEGLSIAAAILEGEDPIAYAGILIEKDEEESSGRSGRASALPLRPPKAWTKL